MTKTDYSFLEDDSMYANNFSYAGLPFSRDVGNAKVDAMIMGVPYDLATTGRAGTRSGPSAVRSASVNLRWEEARWPWDFVLGDRLKVADYGDLAFMPGDSEDMLSQVEAHTSRIIENNKMVVAIGGDHFVTLPLLRATAKHHGKLSLIHFDAHTDTYDEAQEYNHGCMFARAPEEGLLDPATSVQIGIRTEYSKPHPFQVLDAHQVNEKPLAEIIAAIRERVGDNPTYLSFDIDALDPAFAPGTGTPVIGGMTSNKALQILQGIADLNIVGFDLMEVAPSYDHAEITALAGASLIMQFLYMTASRRG